MAGRAGHDEVGLTPLSLVGLQPLAGEPRAQVIELRPEAHGSRSGIWSPGVGWMLQLARAEVAVWQSADPATG